MKVHLCDDNHFSHMLAILDPFPQACDTLFEHLQEHYVTCILNVTNLQIHNHWQSLI